MSHQRPLKPEEEVAGAILDDAAVLPDVDSSALMQFLTSALEDLENAQGEQDDEARSLLAQLEGQLQHQTGPGRHALHDAQSQGPSKAVHLSDLEIASHIDSLTEQLASIETQFASMDQGAKHLLSAGTSVWMASVEQLNAQQQQQQQRPPHGVQGKDQHDAQQGEQRLPHIREGEEQQSAEEEKEEHEDEAPGAGTGASAEAAAAEAGEVEHANTGQSSSPEVEDTGGSIQDTP